MRGWHCWGLAEAVVVEGQVPVPVADAVERIQVHTPGSA